MKTKIKITAIAKDDGFYPFRQEHIGKTGTVIIDEMVHRGGGWFCGPMQLDKAIDRNKRRYFFSFKFKYI